MKQSPATDIINFVKRTYNVIASKFSMTRSHVWPELLYFKRYFHKGQAVLDVGCGNGRLLSLLESYEMDYLGIDISEEMVEEAKKKWPNHRFSVADMTQFPTTGKTYDLIFFVSSLQHIPTHDLRMRTLAHAKKLLNPGGYILMVNWNIWQKQYYKYIVEWSLIKLLPRFIKRRIHLPDFEDFDVTHLEWRDVFIPFTMVKAKDASATYHRYVHAFTTEELHGLIAEPGFKILKNQYMYKGNFTSRKYGFNIVTVVRKDGEWGFRESGFEVKYEENS